MAQAASDSSGFNWALALVAAAALYFVVKYADTAQDAAAGVGGVGRGVGDTAGDAYEGVQDVASDGLDWWLGGGADAVEEAGREVEDAQEDVEQARDAVGGYVSSGQYAEDLENVGSGLVDWTEGVGEDAADAVGGLL